MENSFRDEKQIFSLQVDETVKAHMTEAARWAKFIAIVLFVFLGLLVVGGIAAGALISSVASEVSSSSPLLGAIGGAGIVLMYLIIAALYFYPTYALLKFANLSKSAIRTSNQEQFTKAFGYMKGMYKYIGILIIIFIAIYALIFIFAGIGGLM